MLELIKFSKGKFSFFSGMALLSPSMVAMKLGLLSTSAAKEKMLGHFFKGMPLPLFNETCIRFNSIKLPSLLRKNAMAEMHRHIQNNTEVVVVSASADNWVAPSCNKYGLKFLCTRLHIADNTITGKLDG